MLRSFQLRHSAAPPSAFEDGRIAAGAHDRLIGDDDRRPRRDHFIDFPRKLRIHPQARRDLLGVGTAAATGHPHPATCLATQYQRAHVAGRTFEQREHMIAERSSSADLHPGAPDRVAIVIDIDRPVGAAHDHRDRPPRAALGMPVVIILRQRAQHLRREILGCEHQPGVRRKIRHRRFTRASTADRVALARLNADFFHILGSWIHEARLHPPYTLAVVADRAVGGEFTHARGVEDRLARPRVRVAPERAHAVLRIDVGLIIGEQEEGIVIEQVFDDRTEHLGIAAAERAIDDEVDHFAQRRVLLIMIARAIPTHLHLCHFGGGEAEEEEILRADFLTDFDIRTVEGADGKRPVQRELHVAGAARFLAGSGDLLGQIGGGVNGVRVLYVEVGEEDDLQSVAQGRVVVHQVADGGDELDYALGHKIAGRSLAAEDEGARGYVGLRVAFESQVKRENVQRIEVLPFVFVDALHHHVEKRLGHYGDARPLGD